MSASYTDISVPEFAAVTTPPAQRMSAETFVAWSLSQDVKAEWIDGEVILMSPAGWEHTSLRRWLDGLMTDFAAERGLGIVADDTLVRLDLVRRFRIPDIFFVAAGREAIFQPTMLIEPPDLVVEIVSADSAARDWREKYHEYEASGIREYWVIDPAAGSFDVYILGADGKYQGLQVGDGIVRSSVLTGFWIRTQWLAESTRPAKKDALRQVLAGPS